jgi:hypothetical protein
MDQELGKDCDITFKLLEQLWVASDGIEFKWISSFPIALAKDDPLGGGPRPGGVPENCANQQGQVEDGRSDDAPIASFREDDGY